MVEAATPTTELLRRGSIEGRAEALNGISLLPASPASRVSLRVKPADVKLLSKALGVDLPTRPKTSATANGRSALWLGPDEWLLIDDSGRNLMADLAKVKVLHSAVDISHRNAAVLVTGEHAADVINAGCPQDLSLEVFPVGACSRTVMGKIEIVLLRTAPDAFRVECWRSFADYAFSYLTEAAKGA